MFFTRRDVPGTEQNRKQDQHDTVHERDDLRRGLLGENAKRLGDRPNLKRNIGQCSYEHE